MELWLYGIEGHIMVYFDKFIYRSLGFKKYFQHII